MPVAQLLTQAPAAQQVVQSPQAPAQTSLPLALRLEVYLWVSATRLLEVASPITAPIQTVEQQSATVSIQSVLTVAMPSRCEACQHKCQAEDKAAPLFSSLQPSGD